MLLTLTAHSLSKSSPLRRVHFLYARYGGVPRILLDKIDVHGESEDWIDEVNQYDQEVRMAIREMAAEARPLSTLEDITITQEMSFKAFFYVSADSEESCDARYNVRIATPYISYLLSVEVMETRKPQQRAFYHRLMEVPSLRTGAGKLFESLVHQYFQRNAKFSLGVPLSEESNTGPVAARTEFTIKGWEEFRTLPELGHSFHAKFSGRVSPERQNIYFRLLASNQTAVDSFILSRYTPPTPLTNPSVTIMLQITVASSHDVKVFRQLFQQVFCQLFP